METMTPTIPADALRKVPIFANLPDASMEMLTAVVTRRQVPRGTTVMAAGGPIDSLYVVISGRLKVMMSDSEGKEVILTLLGAGEVFGEMGIIDDSPRSASVVALEACELLCVHRTDFDRCLADNFEMAMAPGALKWVISFINGAAFTVP